MKSDNKYYDPYKVIADDVLEVWEFSMSINMSDYEEEELNVNSILTMMRELKIELREIKNKMKG